MEYAVEKPPFTINGRTLGKGDRFDGQKEGLSVRRLMLLELQRKIRPAAGEGEDVRAPLSDLTPGNRFRARRA